MQAAGYDVIGDVHGYAAALEALLDKLGYRERDGAWGHPERSAIFVGDFVDRGPENLRTCRIVMAMMEAGCARAVMGNHDFNAICLATPDPKAPGAFLRPHTPHNLRQAAATMQEMAQNPDDAERMLAWMRSLPLWIETDHLRVVHAGWNGSAMESLAWFIDKNGALKPEGFVRASRRGDPVRTAREFILNGPETALPPGYSYRDPDGTERTCDRVKWWLPLDPRPTYRNGLVGNQLGDTLPDLPLPAGLFDPDGDARPVVFGHYWMTAPLAPFTPKHACVDASIAKNGRLAAYRFSGETSLTADNFVYA